jgi:hypothetical protein
MEWSPPLALAHYVHLALALMSSNGHLAQRNGLGLHHFIRVFLFLGEFFNPRDKRSGVAYDSKDFFWNFFFKKKFLGPHTRGKIF